MSRWQTPACMRRSIAQWFASGVGGALPGFGDPSRRRVRRLRDGGRYRASLWG